MLHNMADDGELELLAVMNWSGEQYASGAIVAVNEFYGRPVPVGARQGADWSGEWQYSKAILEALDEWPDTSGLPDTTDLYRELLAQQEDGSVRLRVGGGDPKGNRRFFLVHSIEPFMDSTIKIHAHFQSDSDGILQALQIKQLKMIKNLRG